MRILHVVRDLDVGGMEVGLVNLVHRLHAHWARQAVCCLERIGSLAERLPAGVPAWSCGMGGGSTFRPLMRAAQLMRRFRPQVIHARNGGSWTDAGAAWLLAGQPGRLAFSMHGWSQLEPLSPRWALIYRLLARQTSALAAVSPETAQQFAAETGIHASRFRVLYTGVDTDRFRPASRRPAAGRLVLGCVGRLDPVKGHDLLLEAFADVVHDLGVDAELRLIGDGPTRARTEELARQRRIADRVVFAGMRDDVPEQLRELDVFVLASLREGRPTSIMEAMASGLPVVASDVGSVRQLVGDGSTGLVVEPGNVPQLARSLHRLAGDAALRARFSAAGRARAVTEFSMDRMAHDYLEFYRSALAKDGIRRGKSPAWSFPCNSLELNVSRALFRNPKSFAAKVGRRVLAMPSSLAGYRPLLRRFRARSLAVVMYHAVVTEPMSMFLASHLDAGEFAKQMELLARAYRVLPLSEVIDRLHRGQALPRRTVCLTFDDGFRNVLTTALPILQRHHFPATVFLVTGMMGTHQPAWPDRLFFAVQQAPETELAVNGCSWSLTTSVRRRQAYGELVGWLKQLPDEAKEERLQQVYRVLGRPEVPRASSLATLDWADVDELRRTGLVEFGSHTHTHPILPRCAPERQEQELRLSRDVLRERLGGANLLAYPNGDFAAQTKAFAHELGYRCGLATVPGMHIPGEDFYEMRRVCVTADQTLAQFEMRMVGL
jgi:glycosyltransferase involved in cell wall biosynthesis/peptidoglycan/xylan/chitin deacetylase (PgdA/CDA1 family)